MPIERESNVPLYMQLADALQKLYITNPEHRLPVLPSFNEIVKLFNVSKSTIDKAVRILEERGLVEISHGKGIFIIQPGSTRKNSVKNIVLLTHQYAKGAPMGLYHWNIFSGVQKYCQEKGLTVFNWHVPLEEFSSKIISEKQLFKAEDTAYLLCSSYPEVEIAGELLSKHNKNFIYLTWDQNKEVPCIIADDQKGSKLAVRHLAGLGHTKIGFLGWYGGSRVVQRRYEGFIEGLEEAEIEHDPFYDCIPKESDYNQNNEAFIAEYMQRIKENPPTAVICANIVWAIAFYIYCLKYRLTIPGDFSLIGYERLMHDTYIPGMEISTVEYSVSELGYRGAATALGEVVPTRVPINLVINGSVERPKISLGMKEAMAMSRSIK